MSRLASKPCVLCHSPPAATPLPWQPLDRPFVRAIIHGARMSERVRVHAYGTESGPYTRPCTGIIRALYSWGLSLGAARTCADRVVCVRGQIL